MCYVFSLVKTIPWSISYYNIYFSSSFFSKGKFLNPMVLRIPGLAYQKGFGGHFHNDNSLTIFRDIPGLILAVPSNGLDASLMLRHSVLQANENGRIVVFIEPIALYMIKDLHSKKDGEWLEYHENGQLKIKRNYKDGKLEGESLWYHKNGQLESKGNFKDDKKEGEFIHYRSNGKLWRKYYYKEGKKDGKWTWYDTYGNVVRTELY